MIEFFRGFLLDMSETTQNDFLENEPDSQPHVNPNPGNLSTGVEVGF